MVKVELVKTSDGSDTLFRRDLNQHYHSTFGAVEESVHIFIRAGLLNVIDQHLNEQPDQSNPVRILEVGFGSGLNTMLTQVEAEKLSIPIHYSAVEAYPLNEGQWSSLNYPTLAVCGENPGIFHMIHKSAWNIPVKISDYFIIEKIRTKLESFVPPENSFDLVYFDAFGPDAQPELWTEEIFRNIAQGLRPLGLLVTYSVKGTIVKALKAAGFQTEKLPGPAGKRHILRAVKT
jgi:tRNA U34 5-methylaminomethyl-2-thiouridine-forming methyltransferase MnmC